jgi:hypothetical protein
MLREQAAEGVLELNMAVIEGMKSRSEVNGYALQRFLFNCA